MRTYEELVAEAAAAPLDDPDPTYLNGRMVEAEPPWSYTDRANQLVGATDGPVLEMSAGDPLDLLPDDKYAVVLNRHVPYRPTEIRRVLRRDGVFLTEQIGGLDGLAINEALGAPLPTAATDWALTTARAALEEIGMRAVVGRSAFPARTFHDVGALIYYLRAVPGQVPDFSTERYDAQLRALHEQISAAEPFQDRAVRFLLEAVPG